MNNTETIKARENKARRKLAKDGYKLNKYRGTVDYSKVGNYRIINQNNAIVAGENFDLTIDDVEKFAYE